MKKKFWINLGMTNQDILELPETEFSLLREIMMIEEQYEFRQSKK